MSTIRTTFASSAAEYLIGNRINDVKATIDHSLKLSDLTDNETDALRQLYDDISDAMGRFTKTLEGGE